MNLILKYVRGFVTAEIENIPPPERKKIYSLASVTKNIFPFKQHKRQMYGLHLLFGTRLQNFFTLT